MRLDIGFATARQERLQALVQLVKIVIVDRPATLIKLVEAAVEAKQRPMNLRIEILDDGMELIDPVLDRRSGEHESVRRSQGLDAAGGLGLPVLDALYLIEDDGVGLEDVVDVVPLKWAQMGQFSWASKFTSPPHHDPKSIVHVAWTCRCCMKTVENRWYPLRHNAA